MYLCFSALLCCITFSFQPFSVTREGIQIGAALSQSQRKTERTEESKIFKTLRWTQRKGFPGMWITGCFSNYEYEFWWQGNILSKSAWYNFHHMTSTSLPPSPLPCHSCSSLPPPWNAEKCQRSPAGDFPPSGFCDLSPSLSISMPSNGITLEQYCRASNASPSFYPLFFSVLHPLFWISLTFNFFKLALNWHQSWTLSVFNCSLSYSFCPPLPPFSLSFLSLDKHVVKSAFSKACSVLSVSFSCPVFNVNVLLSQWIGFTVKQQVCGVYAPSGPTSPPRQTEGNLHCLNPDSSTARFVFFVCFCFFYSLFTDS